ncbi:MAG: phosphatase PAP2 family protein [Oscillospiraceae bacterium]|nr:phosphatase PAP2 family protein [Oscillospiraceae bacterium]
MILELLNKLAVSFDLPILDWIQAHLQCDFLDFLMPVITLFGEDGIFWIAWAVLMLVLKKHRKTGLGMAFALILGLVVCNMTLKPLIGRIRPYDFQAQNFGITIKLLVDGLHDASFPSGHTIASFEAATVLLLNNKKMGIPAMILACLIAFSRLYLYVHYPTDVLVAIVLGIAFGFLGNFLAGLCFSRTKKGHFEK